MPQPPKPLCETLSAAKLKALPLFERVMAYTIPGAPLHSILACALDQPCRFSAQYRGKLIVTSDGFAMADFVDSDGVLHGGAFVNAFSSIRRNIVALADHMQKKGMMNASERDCYLTKCEDWIGADYSGRASFQPETAAA